MQPLNFEQSVQKMTATDPRYASDAYYFVREALDFTRRNGNRQKKNDRDIGSKELLDGIRRYALETYGALTITVLAEWGIASCEDFGEIVFNMIAHNCEGKSDADKREDFKEGYDFVEAFRKPFLPSARPACQPEPAKV